VSKICLGIKLVTYHFGERIKDVAEKHHSQPLFFITWSTIHPLPWRSTIVLGTSVIMQHQQLKYMS